jgi:hypothetical protein
MHHFVRFQTELRSPPKGCRLGLFCATTVLRRSHGLPDYADELLEESLDWFNENLTVPRLRGQECRSIFWFRTDASECLERIWQMIAIFNVEGLYVEQRTTLRPGHIVYRDDLQIAAIPRKR